MVAREPMLYTWGGLRAALKQLPRVVEWRRKSLKESKTKILNKRQECKKSLRNGLVAQLVRAFG